MIDGPGPPATCLVTVWFAPSRVAWIRSGVNAPWFTRETQRILLLTFGSGGACSGLRSAQRMATISPRSLMTYGMGCVGGWNPARAQAGSWRGDIEDEQFLAAGCAGFRA